MNVKIDKIERDGFVYTVTLTPNFIERIFNVKPRVEQFKRTHNTYEYGGGNIYVDKNGRKLGNQMGYGHEMRESLDRWNNKF
jgi:hypothetical protein